MKNSKSEKNQCTISIKIIFQTKINTTNKETCTCDIQSNIKYMLYRIPRLNSTKLAGSALLKPTKLTSDLLNKIVTNLNLGQQMCVTVHIHVCVCVRAHAKLTFPKCLIQAINKTELTSKTAQRPIGCDFTIR